jgi:glyoxylase I family protein
MTYRFHHYHLICSNLEQMIGFFTEILGAELVGRQKFGTADGALLDLDGAPIYLRTPRQGEEITESESGTYYGYNHVGLEVEDIDTVYHELKDKGFVFTLPPVTGPEAKVAFFKGPDDIVIELCQPVR